MVQFAEKPLNEKAWERFLEIGFPSQSNEAYRYVRLDSLYKGPFYLPSASLIEGIEVEEGTLVFVNGIYCAQLSLPPKPWVALELSAAQAVYGHFLQARQTKLQAQEKDPIALLNTAYFQGGLFLYLPPSSRCSSLLKIVHLVTETAHPLMLCPRIHLFMGKASQGSLLLSQQQGQSGIWTNAFIDLALEQQAELSCCFLNRQANMGHDFLNVRATLKEKSCLNSYAANNGSEISRQDYSVLLQGELASASIYGVWQLKEKREHHVHVHMEHAALQCTSLQKFKGVVADGARSSFEGKILVHPAAQKTNAYQRNNNLVLSESASAYAKPNLEIFADDVKASHGATFGQLNEDELFYLRARGVPLSEARRIVIDAFCSEILDEMKCFDQDPARFLK